MAAPRLTRHPMFHDPDFPSTEDLNDEQRDLVRSFNAKIESGELAMEETACLCGSESFDEVATYDRYRAYQPIVLCRDCGLMRCHPRPTPKSLSWFYGSDFYRELYTDGGFTAPDPADYPELSKTRHPVKARAIDGIDYAKVKTVAEVGCAAGLNLYPFHQDGRKVFGADLSPAMTEAGRGAGMEIKLGSTEQLEGRYDLILIAHVLEHFSDPIKELKTVREHLNPDGALYIEVPNARAFCLGALQTAHLYYFTPALLAHTMAPQGFRPVSTNMVGADVHFGMTFVLDENAPEVPVNGEYAGMRAIIAAHEKREHRKDLLRKTGLFGVARSLYNLVR